MINIYLADFPTICLYFMNLFNASTSHLVEDQVYILGASGIGARFLKLSPASAVCPILTKFSQYTPHSTYYSVPEPIYRQG